MMRGRSGAVPAIRANRQTENPVEIRVTTPGGRYAVTERRREIGIRVALGAQPAQVTRMAMRQTLALTAGGLIGGLVAAAWVGRLMTNVLFGVNAADPVLFAASAPLLIAIVIVASWIPARRVARGNPLNALRAE